jgi:hypothetical protein
MVKKPKKEKWTWFTMSMKLWLSLMLVMNLKFMSATVIKLESNFWWLLPRLCTTMTQPHTCLTWSMWWQAVPATIANFSALLCIWLNSGLHKCRHNVHNVPVKETGGIQLPSDSVSIISHPWVNLLHNVLCTALARSPAAYRALQSFKIPNLPSKSTLQAYTG